MLLAISSATLFSFIQSKYKYKIIICFILFSFCMLLPCLEFTTMDKVVTTKKIEKIVEIEHYMIVNDEFMVKYDDINTEINYTKEETDFMIKYERIPTIWTKLIFNVFQTKVIEYKLFITKK